MARPANKTVALWVLRTLRKAGHQAFFAGGCVRDMLLGVRSADYDVATDATPAQVQKLFRHVLLVGAKFGVAMVIVDKGRVEVTTFRTEEAYSDGRRPDVVHFAGPRQDALRRDFTINGMFYDPIARQVIDYVGGQQDLRAGVIRTIGSPDERFSEDYLRMIRAVRFAVRLGFEIEPDTAAAVRRHADRIAAISGERIFDELSKMLVRPTAGEALEKLKQLGLAGGVLGELVADESVWHGAVQRVQMVANRQDLVLALGAMTCELAVEDVRRMVRRWGASNELRDGLCWFARHLNDWRLAGGGNDRQVMSLADFKRLLANPNFDRLAALWAAQEKRLTGKLLYARRIARRKKAVPPERIAPPPFVTGEDLKAMGLKEGPAVGRILAELYDAQLNEEILSRNHALIAAAEKVDRELKR